MRPQHRGGVTGGRKALSSLAPQQIEFPASSRRLRDLIGVQGVRAASGVESPNAPSRHGRRRPRHFVKITREQYRGAVLKSGQMQAARHRECRPSRINDNTARRATRHSPLGRPPASRCIRRINKERHTRKINATGMPEPRQRRKVRPGAAAHPRHRIGGRGPSAATTHRGSLGRHNPPGQSREQSKRRPGLAKKFMHSVEYQAMIDFHIRCARSASDNTLIATTRNASVRPAPTSATPPTPPPQHLKPLGCQFQWRHRPTPPPASINSPRRPPGRPPARPPRRHHRRIDPPPTRFHASWSIHVPNVRCLFGVRQALRQSFDDRFSGPGSLNTPLLSTLAGRLVGVQ